MGRRHNTGKRWFAVLLMAIGIVITAKALTVKRPPVISPIPDTLGAQTQPPFKPLTIFQRTKKPEDLAAKITAEVGSVWKDYSVIVEAYDSDFRLRLSEGEIFTGASMNKIPILAALYYYAGRGDIDLDQDITLQAADIQPYGTGSIQGDAPGTVYTVKTLAKLMIKQSDNTAAYIIANHIITVENITKLLTEWNLTQTDMVNNKTSNQDIAKLFRMIYENKITDKAHTQEMLSFLKDTDFETRLPGKLPKGSVTVYHKIGTEINTVHDAGIVTDGKRTYYIGIFTRGIPESEDTDKVFADLSKTVYDFMR